MKSSLARAFFITALIGASTASAQISQFAGRRRSQPEVPHQEKNEKLIQGQVPSLQKVQLTFAEMASGMNCDLLQAPVRNRGEPPEAPQLGSDSSPSIFYLVSKNC